MEGNHKKSETRTREKLTVFDPDKLPYAKQHLCVYLRELEEEAEEKETMNTERRR
jgi:hypothetical protein